MPMHMRIPWVASTSLIWTCIISYMRGTAEPAADPILAPRPALLPPLDVAGPNPSLPSSFSASTALSPTCPDVRLLSLTICRLFPPPAGDDMETNPDEAMNIIGGNQGRPLQALYDLGVAAKPCYEYDRSKAH
eukprot:1420504-Prymnesium_polylepis.1